MMATVPHVTSGLGLRKFQANGFLLTRVYHTFSHYLINNRMFGKILLNIKCLLLFSLQLLSETFLILRSTEQDMIINVYTYSFRVPVILARFE